MTHPEFAIDEEVPRTPLLDEQEEENLEKVSTSGTRVLLLDGDVTPYANKNNNAMCCSQVQIVACHPDSPLHSLETSVWTSFSDSYSSFSYFLFISPICKVMRGVFTVTSAAPKYMWVTRPRRGKRIDLQGFWLKLESNPRQVVNGRFYFLGISIVMSKERIQSSRHPPNPSSPPVFIHTLPSPDFWIYPMSLCHL